MKILFVCLGNICRSPMAEFIFRDIVRKAGRDADFEIRSAGTSTYEIGNDIYPPAKQMLRSRGIPFTHHKAHQVSAAEMAYYDLIVVMDGSNLRDLRRMFGARFEEKTRRLLSFAGEERDVSDPWYSDDFETAYRDITAGCQGLFDSLTGFPAELADRFPR